MVDVLIFLASLVAPFVIIRVAIHLLLRRSRDVVMRIDRVRFHHLHLGILLVFAGNLVLLFTGKNLFSLGFLGLGLGLILDEFLPSVLLPDREPENTQLYLGSLRGTIILFLAAVFIALAFFLIS